jgi:transposase-like protein
MYNPLFYKLLAYYCYVYGKALRLMDDVFYEIDPTAEVVALSPTTLMATNRFVCEICNKGFQRDQNLQLHRRGHNLPWKLRQRTSADVKKKVYVCPEPSCVHHNPARALGDLTGIKKHFSRKHGEKKWKCDKCSKRYAVQSDWKAHQKTCGTREYKCDCGTIFSRYSNNIQIFPPYFHTAICYKYLCRRFANKYLKT